MTLALYAIQATGGDLLPRPPAPSAFEAYGFAGVIFASFLFVICAGGVLALRYLTRRDELFVQNQDKRDQSFKDALTGLATSHERAVERVAASAERASEASSAANRETAAAVRELTREVQTTHRAFTEETIAAIFRRAIRDVKSDG